MTLVGGLPPLVAFCSVSLLCSFLTGTKLLSAIAGDGTLPILRFFKAVSRLPELLLHSLATWRFSMKLVSAEAPGKEPRLALLVPGLGKIQQATGSHRKPYEGRQDTR